MELKFGDLQAWKPRSQRSNRTFMELKSVWECYLRNKRVSSNRTFMELKLAKVCSTFLRVVF